VIRAHLEWHWNGRVLTAVEPRANEVAHHAQVLALAYNDPANAPLLGHTDELSQSDVLEHYADLADDGARQFLLFVDGELAGDADLRGVDDGAAEFAFLIATPAAQGQGLGTKFAQMIHAFGFADPPAGAGLDRIYASVVPGNTASLRVFHKLGYQEDHSSLARRYADERDDIVLAIDRGTFAVHHAAVIEALVIRAR
jgi:RimJ/RimL family protein N-acetyltransferase